MLQSIRVGVLLLYVEFVFMQMQSLPSGFELSRQGVLKREAQSGRLSDQHIIATPCAMAHQRHYESYLGEY